MLNWANFFFGTTAAEVQAKLDTITEQYTILIENAKALLARLRSELAEAKKATAKAREDALRAKDYAIECARGSMLADNEIKGPRTRSTTLGTEEEMRKCCGTCTECQFEVIGKYRVVRQCVEKESEIRGVMENVRLAANTRTEQFNTIANALNKQISDIEKSTEHKLRMKIARMVCKYKK